MAAHDANFNVDADGTRHANYKRATLRVFSSLKKALAYCRLCTRNRDFTQRNLMSIAADDKIGQLHDDER